MKLNFNSESGQWERSIYAISKENHVTPIVMYRAGIRMGRGHRLDRTNTATTMMPVTPTSMSVLKSRAPKMADSLVYPTIWNTIAMFIARPRMALYNNVSLPLVRMINRPSTPMIMLSINTANNNMRPLRAIANAKVITINNTEVGNASSSHTYAATTRQRAGGVVCSTGCVSLTGMRTPDTLSVHSTVWKEVSEASPASFFT